MATSISSLTLEVPDAENADPFYNANVLKPAKKSVSKRFYLEHGFAVAKSFGSKYVEFACDGSHGRSAVASSFGRSSSGKPLPSVERR